MSVTATDPELIWREQAVRIVRAHLTDQRISVRELHRLTHGVLSATTLNRALRADSTPPTRRTIWALVEALGLSRTEFRDEVRERVVDALVRSLHDGAPPTLPSLRVDIDRLMSSADPNLEILARMVGADRARAAGEMLISSDMIHYLATFTGRSPWDCWTSVAGVIDGTKAEAGSSAAWD